VSTQFDRCLVALWQNVTFSHELKLTLYHLQNCATVVAQSSRNSVDHYISVGVFLNRTFVVVIEEKCFQEETGFAIF
jgi:hypothetical protein